MATSASVICSRSTVKTPKPKRFSPDREDVPAGATTRSSPASESAIRSLERAAVGGREGGGGGRRAAVVGRRSDRRCRSRRSRAPQRRAAGQGGWCAAVGVAPAPILGRRANHRLSRARSRTPIGWRRDTAERSERSSSGGASGADHGRIERDRAGDRARARRGRLRGDGLGAAARRSSRRRPRSCAATGLDVHGGRRRTMTDEEQIVALFAAHTRALRAPRRARQQRRRRDRRGDDRDHETKKLDMQLGVNLRGVILATREATADAAEAGAEHGKALIVNTASIAGKAGQAWLVGLLGDQGRRRRASARRRRRRTASDGIQVTALCPGVRRHADDRVRQGPGAGRRR